MDQTSKLYIENSTWVRGNTRFISSVEHDISRVSAVYSVNIKYPEARKVLPVAKIPKKHCTLYNKRLYFLQTVVF